MKNQITLNENHPAFLVITDFATKVSRLQTESQVRELARKELTQDTPFFWGCGSSHLWVHHAANPSERVFIAYF